MHAGAPRSRAVAGADGAAARSASHDERRSCAAPPSAGDGDGHASGRASATMTRQLGLRARPVAPVGMAPSGRGGTAPACGRWVVPRYSSAGCVRAAEWLQAREAADRRGRVGAPAHAGAVDALGWRRGGRGAGIGAARVGGDPAGGCRRRRPWRSSPCSSSGGRARDRRRMPTLDELGAAAVRLRRRRVVERDRARGRGGCARARPAPRRLIAASAASPAAAAPDGAGGAGTAPSPPPPRRRAPRRARRRARPRRATGACRRGRARIARGPLRASLAHQPTPCDASRSCSRRAARRRAGRRLRRRDPAAVAPPVTPWASGTM